MMMKRQVLSKKHSRGLAFVITSLLYSSCLFASGHTTQNHTAEPLQFKIFPLTNISSKQAQKLLSEARIGTVSRLPDSNALLITGSADELTKARSIVGLIDTKEQFILRVMLPSEGIEKLPSNRQIAEAVGNISIGTLSNPPPDTAAARAIIDIHNDAVIVVAPQNLSLRVVSAIEGKTILPEVGETKVEQAKTDMPTLPPSKIKEPETEQITAEPEQPGEVIEPAMTTHQYEPAPIPDGEQELKLSLPQTVSIIDLLGLVGKHLQLDFMYDPKKIVGDVTLMINGEFRGPMKVKDLYPMLESVLKFKGFVMSRGPGNLVKIVPEAEALDIDPALLKVDKGKVEHGDVIVSRVFQLQYIDTASAQNFLTTMKLATNVTPIAETGTLIVTDYAYRMPRIEELLEIIDKPGKLKQFRFRQLRYTMAKTLAPKVKTLAEQLGTVSISIGATSGAATPIQRRQGESTAAYQRRLQAARRAPPTAPSAEPTESTVYLDTDERTNRILMIGLEEQLAVVDELIDILDVEQQDLRTLKSYKIENIDAEEAKKKLQELGIIGGSRPTTPSRITAPGRAAPPEAAPQTPAIVTTSEGLVEEPQIVVIEMTNSLLVNATAEQHAQITRILAYVDSKTEEEEIPYKIYALENQKPEDLAGVINQLIQETVKDKEGKVQQVIKKTEDEIIVIPDENTFSLIVYASRKNQEWIASLIKQLDKRRPQVLIDVTLVAISESDAFDYDLQLVTKLPQLEVGGSMDKLTALLAPESTGFPFHQIIEGTSALGDASSAKGFYADRHIQALLSLMQKKGYGRILARPKILVNDNENGHIDTKNTIYVSRSASTVVTTGGETPISTSYTFDEFPSGIQLDITPHISEGNLLRLEITMSRSSQTAPEGGITENKPPPDKSESNVETIVTVPDKSTIILGGITTLDQAKSNWKVPLLGDVPLVGGLFRKIDNTSRQTKLYIFVKADILRPDRELDGLPDLERISGKNRMAFEKFEERFQKYRDWPGIKSKPMDPVKVLEAD